MSRLSCPPTRRAAVPALLGAFAALSLLGCSPVRGGEHDDPTGDGGITPREDMARIVKVTDPDLVDNGAPPDAKDQFGGAGGGAAPALVYPLDGAMMARNISQIRLAWRAGGHRLFRLVIDGPTYARTLYLGAMGCAADRCSYVVSDDEWAKLARAAAGGQVTLTLSGTAGAGQPVGSAAPLTLRFSPEDVRGGLYYFATSTRGLWRLPFGGTKAMPFNTNSTCVGCHQVSQDGKKVSATFRGGDGNGGIVDGADGTRVIVAPNTQRWNFSSFNPDGSRLITVWAGEMQLRDGQNGAIIRTVSAAQLGGRATMPEWSPDGKSIVYVRIQSPDGRLGKDIATNPGIVAGDWIIGDAGEIAVVPYNDGNFGDATTIVARTQGQEFHTNPSFAPDSQWIVFNSARKAECASPTAMNNGVNVAGLCMSYDQRAARLRLVRAQAGATPIELTAATRQANMTTAWPKFAPFQQSGGRLVFFTFSAKTEYGWVVAANQRPQIWMSAIDLSKAGGGGDPSYAPFWLPFQDSSTNNHEVIWTKDIACVRDSDCGDEFTCAAGVCVPRLG